MGLPPRTIRVLIVDDHDMVGDAIARILGSEPDIHVVGVARSVADAQTLAATRPDVVLMDYRLPDGTGADATRLVKAAWPRARVVMLSGLTDDDTMLASIQAGADAYLTKFRALAEVVALVRSAAAGDVLVEPGLVAVIAQRVSELREHESDRVVVKTLTYRELQVLRLLAAGASTAEISRRLMIGPRTVGAHVRNLTAKLGVRSRLEAVAFAHRHRLVDEETDPSDL